MRKLATVRRIAELNPIEGADAIECAKVDGWKVVVKKGEFAVGQLATYFEIDSWIPEDIAPFLCKDKREFNGIPGARLRTIRLRGQVSQGLLLPAPVEHAEEGDDLTEVLGIQKWEPPVSAQLSGLVRGNFPGFLQKTDQERVQNLSRDLDAWRADDSTWEVTEKLDGSSMTAYIRDGEFGVCSRNLDLTRDESNSFWATAIKLQLEERMARLGRNIAIQGELIGPGIQGNRYALDAHQFMLFDVFDIDQFQYLTAAERIAVATELSVLHCPILSASASIENSVDELLLMAEGPSALPPHPQREGLVYKCTTNPSLSFKVISNKFLLAEK